MKNNAIHPHLEVRKSDIHGKGLFASGVIKKGEQLGVVSGRRVQQDGPHVLWVGEGQGLKVSGPLKYINHSNKPNACYYDDLTVMALKNIKAGEEITHYYGEGWE